MELYIRAFGEDNNNRSSDSNSNYDGSSNTDNSSSKRRW